MQFRRFNYKGDITWLKGKVTGKRVENGDYLVELEVWGEDQRGRTTTPGSVVVRLPSKVGGPVKLPVVTPDWW